MYFKVVAHFEVAILVTLRRSEEVRFVRSFEAIHGSRKVPRPPCTSIGFYTPAGLSDLGICLIPIPIACAMGYTLSPHTRLTASAMGQVSKQRWLYSESQ
jgi:hypothetical protein